MPRVEARESQDTMDNIPIRLGSTDAHGTRRLWDSSITCKGKGVKIEGGNIGSRKGEIMIGHARKNEDSRVGDGERSASSKCHSILTTGSGLNEAIILINLEGKV
jgi:hypothetical protein